jgi:hypothetical protein
VEEGWHPRRAPLGLYFSGSELLRTNPGGGEPSTCGGGAAALVGSTVVGSNDELHGVRLSWEAVSSSTKPPLVGPAEKQLDLFKFFLNFVNPKVSSKKFKLEKFTCFVESIARTAPHGRS